MTGFPPPLSDPKAQDETNELRPKFNPDGLIPAIAQDHETKDVLMMAWMNTAALQQTLATRRATYYSRSRQKMWVKGESSGHYQDLVDIRLDCDQDTVLLLVKQHGNACHTNRKSCFYRQIQDGQLSKDEKIG